MNPMTQTMLAQSEYLLQPEQLMRADGPVSGWAVVVSGGRFTYVGPADDARFARQRQIELGRGARHLDRGDVALGQRRGRPGGQAFLDQRAQALPGLLFLVTPDQVADVFAGVAVVP